ncbi:hypothetical protein BT63DRAFT_415767 [Microthyrium microscopicum]|uniref:Zn(2)-C6 fungal-type domain-containing protein n=1 Tax=Microthyrium microscopicum TaxID=703497 RepID=A0A6A6U6B5_9PEZI|nr:hypothetical protein BT63DRAFT_415767 [Microthyrium microscopicum]
MSSPHSDSYDSHARKRVGKACDRCRLKKSKCDGSSPCSRCKIDNAICVFGERKKSQDRVYPKGYVEMLEQQQTQVVSGLRETYRILVEKNLWPGTPLKEYEGHPLTHDILERLNVLHLGGDSPAASSFEDDLDTLQQRLMSENGASSNRQRRSSPSCSESEPGLSHTDSPHSTPQLRTSSVSSPYSRKRSPSTPLAEEEIIPVKHQRTYEAPHPRKLEELQRQIRQLGQIEEPWVVSSPEMDVPLDLSFATDASSMYDPLYVPNNLLAQQNYMVSSTPLFGVPTFDADWDSFAQSGLHGTI